MGCKNFDQKLHELLDGQGSPEEMQRISAHLKTCSACASDFRNLKLLDRSLKGFPLYQLGPSFNQKVLAALGVLPVKKPLTPWRLRAAILFLSLVSAWMAFFVFWLAGPMGSERLAIPFQGLFHASHPWLSLELFFLKGFLEGVRWIHSTRGWLTFLFWEFRSPSLWLQWAFSSLLAAVLVFFLAGNSNSTFKRRTT